MFEQRKQVGGRRYLGAWLFAPSAPRPSALAPTDGASAEGNRITFYWHMHFADEGLTSSDSAKKSTNFGFGILKGKLYFFIDEIEL